MSIPERISLLHMGISKITILVAVHYRTRRYTLAIIFLHFFITHKDTQLGGFVKRVLGFLLSFDRCLLTSFGEGVKFPQRLFLFELFSGVLLLCVLLLDLLDVISYAMHDCEL